jgi:hypothetical protein
MRREDFFCQLGEPSTHGTKLTFANVYSFVLFRGEADMHGPLALPAPVANDPSATLARNSCCDAQALSPSNVIAFARPSPEPEVP